MRPSKIDVLSMVALRSQKQDSEVYRALSQFQLKSRSVVSRVLERFWPVTWRARSNVLFVPDWRQGNPYLERLAGSLQSNGFHVSFSDYPEASYLKITKLIKAYPNIGVVHLHWTTGLLPEIFWSGSEIKKKAKLLLFGLDLLLTRLRGVQLIWTVHNLTEHETPDQTTEIASRRLLASLASGVIVHSQGALDRVLKLYRLSLKDRFHVIPHGNFLGHYQTGSRSRAEVRATMGLSDSDFVVLFFGTIRKYKGLDILIDQFKATLDQEMRLLIAGRPFTEEMANWIQAEADSDPRILLFPHFISDEDVGAFFSASDVVACPFHQTLTSGSVILAMGFGKCLLLPEDARVLDIPGDEGAFYFSNRLDLTATLSSIREINVDKKGRYNANLALELDWGEIGRQTAKVYLR